MISKVENTVEMVTYEEFCALVPDGQKADLIDGVVYMASPDSMHANKINLFIAYLVEGYIGAKGISGEVRLSRAACRLTRFNAPEPDVMYVRPERTHLIEFGQLNGAPDIAVEIVARESRDRDYTKKRDLYEAAGVTEYWIIDPLQQRCEFLRLVSGKYETAALDEGHIFHSSVIRGFWIDVDWLLAEKVPVAYECQSLLLN